MKSQRKNQCFKESNIGYQCACSIISAVSEFELASNGNLPSGVLRFDFGGM